MTRYRLFYILLFTFKVAVADTPQGCEVQNVQSKANPYEKISLQFQNQKKYIESIQNELLFLETTSEASKLSIKPYYEKVKKLLPRKDSLNRTRLYYRFGLLLEHKGELKRAVVFINEALLWAVKLKNYRASAIIANELGGIYGNLGEWKLSSKKYEEVLQAAKNLGDSNLMAAAYLNLGDNYKEAGSYTKGSELMINALRLKERSTDRSHLSFYYLKAAELAWISQNKAHWVNYIKKAAELKDESEATSPAEKAMIYNKLGAVAEYENDMNKAIRYYDTLMVFSKKIHYTSGIRTSFSNRAALYKKEGQVKQALKILLQSDKYPSENPIFNIRSNNQKAELYLILGQPKRALGLLQQNLKSGLMSNYVTEKLRSFDYLYQSNLEIKRYRTALMWSDSLRSLENRIRDKDVAAKITELDTKYETEKKEQKIQLLEAEHKIYDQQIKLGIFLIAGLIVVILLGFYMQRLNRLKAEYRESLLQQQLLRAQMNPHFIFNALTSIQNFMLKNQSEKAALFLGKFTSITRLVLEYSTQESIPLSLEMEIIENYIEIEKMRAQDSFSYVLEANENMETEFIHIPPMALQPFVENAIKHGLKEKGGGLLRLTLREKGNNILEVIIEDNGPGIDASRKEKREQHRSMAMEIFEKRRKLWQKRNKKILNLSVVDLNTEGSTGTRITVELPVLT